MEWYDYLKDKWHLDTVIVAIVILSGFFQEKYLCIWQWLKDKRFDASVKVLAVSSVVSLVYILLMHKEAKHLSEDGAAIIPWGKYFISYFAATSLYDLAIRPIRKWITARFGGESDTPKPE